MPVPKVFNTSDPDTFKVKALHWANSFNELCYFDSNHHSDPYTAFDIFIAAGAKKRIIRPSGNAFEQLEAFLADNSGFIPGYFSYDLKNELEDLKSLNPDHLNFPDLYFFIPENTILIKGSEVKINNSHPETTWETINNFDIPVPPLTQPVEISSRFTKGEYESTVSRIQEHIQRGDIYEINLCQEFMLRMLKLIH